MVMKPRDMIQLDRSLITERFPLGGPLAGAEGLRLTDGHVLYGCRGGCAEVFDSPSVAHRHRYHEWPHQADGKRRDVITYEAWLAQAQAPPPSADLALPGMPAPAPAVPKPRQGRDVGREVILDAGARTMATQAYDFMSALIDSRDELQEMVKSLQAENDRLMRIVREVRTIADTALGG